MDQRERIGDRTEAMHAMLDDAMANAWHCLPAIVQSYNAVKNTCVAQPSIKMQVRNSKGATAWQQLPVLVDVPVCFPNGGGFMLTLPIQQGDEVLVLFADRCIDAWWQNGGAQQQVELRLHDLSDGFAVPGTWSMPRVPVSISTSSAQLRNLDGSAYIELAAGGVVNIKAPGGLNLNGAMVATGEITAKNTHTVSAHTHSDPQGGSTGTPTG